MTRDLSDLAIKAVSFFDRYPIQCAMLGMAALAVACLFFAQIVGIL